MLAVADRKAVLAYAKGRFRLDVRGDHGPIHWARVRTNGLRLAKMTGADTTVVELFALLHDSERHDEYLDPQHGWRAAERLIKTLADLRLDLTLPQVSTLHAAIGMHSDGLTVVSGGSPLERVTIATCWDADRLDLGRVGIVPDPMRLCTDAARDLLDWAYRRSIKKLRVHHHDARG